MKPVNLEDAVELVSLEELIELEKEIDDGYVEVEVDEFDDELEEVEVDGLGLWNRTSRRQEKMTLDRETLRDLYGDADYELY